jgi:predicted transposase/invertase (TIGR01784 family)
MPHYLDPKNDLTFKRVFGEHKHLCMSLLNSMLPLDESQRIVDIEYRTGELLPELPDVLRNSIVDVRCMDTLGRQFLVEMQLYWSESFRSRVLFNASKAYVRQLDKSKDFKLLKPVYALSFVNSIFETSPEMKEEYYHHYKIVNIHNTEKQIKGLEFVFVELPKFRPENRAEKKLQDLWLRFLTEIDPATEEVPAELLANSDTREAIGYVETGAYTKAELDAYDMYLNTIMVTQGVMSDAEARGRQEGKAEVVMRAAEKGYSPKDISDLTGLSRTEIDAILNSKPDKRTNPG